MYQTNVLIQESNKRDVILSMNMQHMASRWQWGKDIKSAGQKPAVTKWAGRNLQSRFWLVRYNVYSHMVSEDGKNTNQLVFHFLYYIIWQETGNKYNFN